MGDYSFMVSKVTLGVGLTMSAAIGALPAQARAEKVAAPYVVDRADRTYSGFSAGMTVSSRHSDLQFALKVASIYHSLEKKQVQASLEIEAAIFSDLDSLYEA